MGAKPPLDPWNLLISGGFQAQRGADTPFWKENKIKPPPLGQIPEYAPETNIIIEEPIDAILSVPPVLTLLFAESISAWSNQGSVMCLLSILNQ